MNELVGATIENLERYERTSEGIEATLAEGGRVGRSGSNFGYRYVFDRAGNRSVEKDPKAAKIVVDLFKRFADGASVNSLATLLTARGVETPGKRKGKGGWYTYTVNEMLHNRAYLGEMKFGDTVIPNSFPPIVSEELFEKVQARFATYAPRRRADVSIENTLGAGLGTCAHCGTRVAFQRNVGTGAYYYSCFGFKIADDKSEVCRGGVSAKLVDETIRLFLNEVAELDPKVIRAAIARFNTVALNGDGPEAERLTETIAELEKKERNLAQGMAQALADGYAAEAKGLLVETRRTLEAARKERDLLAARTKLTALDADAIVSDVATLRQHLKTHPLGETLAKVARVKIILPSASIRLRPTTGSQSTVCR